MTLVIENNIRTDKFEMWVEDGCAYYHEYQDGNTFVRWLDQPDWRNVFDESVLSNKDDHAELEKLLAHILDNLEAAAEAKRAAAGKILYAIRSPLVLMSIPDREEAIRLAEEFKVTAVDLINAGIRKAANT